ncbi:MAG: PocR ligand-binding domain-containing protein [Acidobacteriales bacterium]|nr:PocR ligand-binding domain-containing protein [Terriglobales bacterium]
MTSGAPAPPEVKASTRAAAPEESLELSPALRSDLLDFTAWSEILTTFGRTITVAVALTDCQGNLLGECHNPQPVWSMLRHAASNSSSACPFCVVPPAPCTAVNEALATGKTVMMRDGAGLTHVAVPLILENKRLGAIIAGQVFDRYPDSLILRRVSRSTGAPPQKLWDVARNQRPVSGTILQASADLLLALGHAFLQQRYGAILKTKLSETNRHFRILVEGATQHALFTMDSSGLVTSWNSGARRMLGYDFTIVGQSFSRIFTQHDIDASLPEKHLSHALETGKSDHDGWLTRNNHNEFWAHISITSLLHQETSGADLAVIIQDATEQRALADAMEESRRGRARLQDKFLSHVSHELRTPLTAIYFFTTNLLDGLLGDLTPEQHEHLSMALPNVSQLKHMVGDLLDITRADTHKLSVEPRRVDASELMVEIVKTCRGMAATKGVTLECELAPCAAFIWADASRVRQILTNLIDNAIKFTAPKGIVTVASRIYLEDSNFLLLSVCDSGCGISAENCKIVFDRLAQVRSANEESRSGLGLGLFIARELVLLHGGSIWVESVLEQGSTFFFTLPLFSTTKLYAPILTDQNIGPGFVTLIAVELTMQNATQLAVADARRILEKCIHDDRDVLLPSMSEGGPVQSFFIVACTDAAGFAIMAQRIRQQMQKLSGANSIPVICSQTLSVRSTGTNEERILEIASRIEQVVDAHLSGKARLVEWKGNPDR